MYEAAHLNFKASVGICCLSKYGATIGDVLKYNTATGSLDAQRLFILRQYTELRMEQLNNGLYEADPIKVFIKQEPHKISKLQEGRYRLISSVSMLDSMIDRILFSPLMEKSVSQLYKTPIAIGWSPLKGGYRILSYIAQYSASNYVGVKYLFVDKSAWDWTVPRWLLNIVMNIIIDLYVEYPPWWQKCVIKRFEMLFIQADFQFSDGMRIPQRTSGIMKSGCYLTILINSIAQLYLHNLICEYVGIDLRDFPLLCIGDDTAITVSDGYPQDKIDSYIQSWKDLGFKLKISNSNKLIFAGYVCSHYDFLPEYIDKHAFMMQHLTFDPDVAESTLISYQHIYAFSPPILKFLRKIAVERGLLGAVVLDSQLRKNIQ